MNAPPAVGQAEIDAALLLLSRMGITPKTCCAGGTPAAGADVRSLRARGRRRS